MTAGPKLQSLNDVWLAFVRDSKAYLADPEPEREDFTHPLLVTDVVIRFADGHGTNAQIDLRYLDNTEPHHGPAGGGHIGVQLTLYDHPNLTTFDLTPEMPTPEMHIPWTRDEVEVAFDIDPTSPIWERTDY